MAGGTARRHGAEVPVQPLGSLSQSTTYAAGTAVCGACGSDRLTRVRLRLADGTEVTFVSCHACEHRAWIPVEAGQVLDRDQVVRRAARS